jgi:hypothetical protein
VHGAKVTDEVAGAPVRHPRDADVEIRSRGKVADRQLLRQDAEPVALLDDSFDAPLAQRLTGQGIHGPIVPDR